MPDRYTFEGQPVIAGWGVVPAKCCVAQATSTASGMLLLMTDGTLLLAQGSTSPRTFSPVQVTGGRIGENASLIVGSSGMPIGFANASGVQGLVCQANAGQASGPMRCRVNSHAAAELGAVHDTAVVPTETSSHSSPAAAVNGSTVAFIASANGLFRATLGLASIIITHVITPEMAHGTSPHDKYPPSALSPTPMLATSATPKLIAAGNSVKVWLLNPSGKVLSWSWVTAPGSGAGGVYDDTPRSMEVSLTIAIYHKPLVAEMSVALNVLPCACLCDCRHAMPVR